jgi:hypothetical protein
MPYFKESMYIDEELRQELNIALETGNQAYIDGVLNRIFDDQLTLLRGARATREAMRMMALTTGVVSMYTNGQMFNFDYGVKNNAGVAMPWSEPHADAMGDIRAAIDKIQENTGETVTRAICGGKAWTNLRKNQAIISSLLPGDGGTGYVSDNMLRVFIKDSTGVDVLVNNKRYRAELTGASRKYVGDDVFVLFPDGALGSTWFGTTPAESDLMTGSAANVSVVDTGVAVVSSQKVDPVQVETIVSMICLPSFERADSVYILNTEIQAPQGASTMFGAAEAPMAKTARGK